MMPRRHSALALPTGLRAVAGTWVCCPSEPPSSSSGNAAILFQNEAFCRETRTIIDSFRMQPAATREIITGRFRHRLEAARRELRERSANAAPAFFGLLEGLEPILYTPCDAGASAGTLNALAAYAVAAPRRVAKASLWAQSLRHAGLQSVGMGTGCVPWRYACRLEGITWATQHRLAEEMRASNIHVSNWYLPAHWLVNRLPDTLPGAETLSCEVFQFWLDEATSYDSVRTDAAKVNDIVLRA